MTLKGGTSQACAACKYQRRRCLPECQLAPYFPADKPKMFQNAHRLFGVSNILKILKEVDPSMRNQTMRSIIFESDVRSEFPVLGCYGYICELEYQVRIAEEELQLIRSQIALCKMQQCHNHNIGNIEEQVLIGENEGTASMLYLGMGPPATNKNEMLSNKRNVDRTMMFGNEVLIENDHIWGNQDFDAGNNLIESELNDLVKLQQHFTSSQYHHDNQIQMNNNLMHHFEGMHTFFDGIDNGRSVIDDGRSVIDSKAMDGTYESSSDSTGSTKAPKCKDLKNAAARFSLTS